jgi:hypothetical protein
VNSHTSPVKKYDKGQPKLIPYFAPPDFQDPTKSDANEPRK